MLDKKLTENEIKLIKIIDLLQEKVNSNSEKVKDAMDILLENLEKEVSAKNKLKKDNKILIEDNKIDFMSEIAEILKTGAKNVK